MAIDVAAAFRKFKDRTNAVFEGVMASLRDDTANETLGPDLSGVPFSEIGLSWTRLSENGMSPLATAAIVMVATTAAAAIGLIAQRFLPEHNLGSETKDTVRLVIGTVTSMNALVLGLATASAKNTYDLTCRNVQDASIDLITIDRMLRRYGDEAIGEGASDNYDPIRSAAWIEDATNRIHSLEPRDAMQEGIKSQLVRFVEAALRARWALATEQHARMPLFFLLAIGSWLAVTFFSYGLFAQRNTVVFLALFLCSLSVSSAIFLILEMERPFSGFVRIRTEGIRHMESTLLHPSTFFLNLT